MKYTIPHYFEQFRCTAAECVDTCCAGWAIMIDEKSLEKYKIQRGLWETAFTIQSTGRKEVSNSMRKDVHS